MGETSDVTHWLYNQTHQRMELSGETDGRPWGRVDPGNRCHYMNKSYSMIIEGGDV